MMSRLPHLVLLGLLSCLLGGQSANAVEKKVVPATKAKAAPKAGAKPAPPKAKAGNAVSAKPVSAPKQKAGAAVAAKSKPVSREKPGAKIAAKPVPVVAAKPVAVAVAKPARATEGKMEPKPIAMPAAVPVDAKDERELIQMPSPARLAMRAEMRDRMSALDEVLKLLVAGKIQDAGELAILRLGTPVWGGHAKLAKPAQPEQYMPEAMRRLALEGFRAASDFGTAARTGDRETAFAMLPQLTGSCAHCHESYRIR